jgi:hypothetical protein
MPFVKMNAPLRENYPGVADFSQDEAAGVTWHRRLGKFDEVRITDALLRVRFGDENVQTGTENDGDCGIPGAQPIQSVVAHGQAAEIGGADSGFRVPAITSGWTATSRIGVILVSCFG